MFVSVVFVMTGSNREESPEPVTPEVFNLLKKVSDSVEALTNRIAALEVRSKETPSVELRSENERGGPSFPEPRDPLVSQQAAYEAFLRTSQPPSNPPYTFPTPPNYGYVPTASQEQPPTFSTPPNAYNHNFGAAFPANNGTGFQGGFVYPGGHPFPFNNGGQRFPPAQDGIGKIKVRIPTFEGKVDPDVYMAWETKIEQIWSCHNFAEDKKVQLAALEFNGYAMIWWDNLVKERVRVFDQPIASWTQMKALMRARFVPQHYARELRQRLEQLRQGSMSAEEAYTAMQEAMARANIIEDEEATMARYFRILNKNLANEVDMYPYNTMIEMLHLTIKAETKLRDRAYSGNYRAPSTATRWRPPMPNPGADAGQQRTVPKPTTAPGSVSRGATAALPTSTSKPSSSDPLGPKGSTTVPTSRTRDIVCFKCNGRGHVMRDCPNKRVLVVDQSGNYNSESDNDDVDYNRVVDNPTFTHDDNEGIEYMDGEVLVVRRTLHAKPKPCEDNQRELISHKMHGFR